VTDEGQGMGREVLERAFEPFFTTKKDSGGTGLGLTTVYAFAKNCGGHVEIASEVGKGTTVCLFLPPAGEERAPRSSRPAPPPAVLRGAETILVVDDQQMVARSLQKMLERNGYHVLVANNGQDALGIVYELGREISLVVVDVLMPGMTGPELGQRFAEMELPAKILYVSGFAPGEGRIDPEHLLLRPFSPSDLLGRIRRLLDA
jgi:CheY-like chemotaxis protein